MSPVSPEYSICITNFNDISTIEKSLESVLRQVDERFEVLVVDNFSTDGSYEVLKRYSDNYSIKLIRAKCSRGLGRQIAFVHSLAPNIVANFDMDDFMLPRLGELLALFHERYEGKLVRVRRSPVEGREQYCNITLAKRETIVKLGGWRDMNWYEDADLWNRANRVGLLEEINFPILIRGRIHPERESRMQRLTHRFLTYRECERATLWKRVDLKVRLATFPIYLMAWLDAKLKPLPEVSRFPEEPEQVLVHGE